MLKVYIKKLAAWRRIIPLLDSCIYDFQRYVRFSSIISSGGDEEKLRAVITAHYHNIEKGLSLREPRLGFGGPVIRRLIGYLRQFIIDFGPRDHINIPIGALNSYVQFHQGKGYDVSWLVRELAAIEVLMGGGSASTTAGVVHRTRADIEAAILKGGIDLLLSRSSCRQFTAQPVSDDMILKSALVAQKSPVVCNRQSGKLRVFRERAQIDTILELHTGARGFSSEVPLLFCVTVDLRNFNGVGERYQGWIDGGMFAMSLVFGLHAQGLGSCCLNWSKDRRQDQLVRSLLGIPNHEQIIMFVAAGHLPESLVVASSVRKPLSEVVADGLIRL